MMFFRKTIILFFILIVAVGTYWYFEVKEKKKEVSKEKPAPLFEPSDRQIVTIILKKKGNPDIVLEKKSKEAVALFRCHCEKNSLLLLWSDRYEVATICKMIYCI